MYIESDKNPRIKNLVKLLEKSKERKSQKRFVVEGRQENFFALRNKFQPVEYYIQPEIFQDLIELPAVATYEVSQSVYNKIAYRKITEGIVGVYEYKSYDLSKIELSGNPFILVIESVEKPGNLGAICRSADAFGVDMVILCEEKSDPYNPNVIRSSVGSVFTIPVISSNNEKIYEFLKKNGISIYATYMNETSICIQDAELSTPSAIVFGTEHSGVSGFWKDKIEQNILIPMRGKVDSLNVSNAVAVACYEVVRQRIILK
ncbi:MAG: RNA methyltransferase [Flavobacteriaceae bacterium]|jgi:TrmH family RNA methyltransferase|nr:RNA methyltransferase [Flavobacteriaceae bacterium]